MKTLRKIENKSIHTEAWPSLGPAIWKIFSGSWLETTHFSQFCSSSEGLGISCLHPRIICPGPLLTTFAVKFPDGKVDQVIQGKTLWLFTWET